MKDTSITIRIDSKTKDKLEKIALVEDRSVSWILTKIIKEYLSSHPLPEE